MLKCSEYGNVDVIPESGVLCFARVFSVGVFCFSTRTASRRVSNPWSGVQILQIKNEQGRHKPLSLLCKDISTMNTYAKGIDKVILCFLFLFCFFQNPTADW